MVINRSWTFEPCSKGSTWPSNQLDFLLPRQGALMDSVWHVSLSFPESSVCGLFIWGRSVMTSSTQSRRPCPCWADRASACTALFQHRLRISETLHCAVHLAPHVWSPAGCVLAICSWAAKHAGSDSCLQFKRCAEMLPTGATGEVWFFKFCPSSYLPWWVFCITIRSIMYVLCMSYVCLMSVLCMSYVLYVLCFVLCFVPWMVSLSSICHFLPLPILLLNICPYHSLSACISVSIYNPYVYWFLSHVSLYAFDFIRLNCVNPLCACMVHIRDGYLYTLHVYERTMGWRWTCLHSSAYPCVWMHITYVCRTGVCKICMCSVVRHAGAHQHPHHWHRNQCNIRHVYIYIIYIQHDMQAKRSRTSRLYGMRN